MSDDERDIDIESDVSHIINLCHSIRNGISAKLCCSVQLKLCSTLLYSFRVFYVIRMILIPMDEHALQSANTRVR